MDFDDDEIWDWEDYDARDLVGDDDEDCPYEALKDVWANRYQTPISIYVSTDGRIVVSAEEVDSEFEVLPIYEAYLTQAKVKGKINWWTAPPLSMTRSGKVSFHKRQSTVIPVRPSYDATSHFNYYTHSGTYEGLSADHPIVRAYLERHPDQEDHEDVSILGKHQVPEKILMQWGRVRVTW